MGLVDKKTIACTAHLLFIPTDAAGSSIVDICRDLITWRVLPYLLDFFWCNNMINKKEKKFIITLNECKYLAYRELLQKYVRVLIDDFYEKNQCPLFEICYIYVWLAIENCFHHMQSKHHIHFSFLNNISKTIISILTFNLIVGFSTS